MRDFNINTHVCNKLLNRFREFESNSFYNLEQWLKENHYEYRMEWGPEPPNKFPRVIVVASTEMRQNYVRYGDVLAFDITYGLLRNVAHDQKRYRVGVFTVHDANLRLLLTGIAMIVD